MGAFTLTIDIARPPGDVFAVVADPCTMPRWYEAVEQVTKSTDHPEGRGGRYHVVRALPGGRADNDVDVTEFEAGRCVTLESRSGPTPFRYRYHFEPRGKGTRLTLDAHISGEGLAGPLAAFGGLATQLFKRGMRQNLDALRQMVETS